MQFAEEEYSRHNDVIKTPILKSALLNIHWSIDAYYTWFKFVGKYFSGIKSGRGLRSGVAVMDTAIFNRLAFLSCNTAVIVVCLFLPNK